ncbi:hypothetical protein HII28_14710 [Planctomonas sp. JC2975]|uniref:hypothetical protein n=1 Tax=Planctomonas sp. JC2975 TaxID=2729626 RepID=UPI00147393E6|nr:hypothetical protein [Planctomonas sp. JC2975]NNC13124.1 hypothetical protein [Planctomonas sp. JC2975]
MLLGCLVALLSLESLCLIAVVIWLSMQAAQTAASDVPTGLALLIIAALCAVWVVLTTVGAARRRSWMRGSTITLHILVFAIAIGSFTGVTAVPEAGWVLLIVAALGIGLVLAPSVTRATARRIDAPSVDDDSSASTTPPPAER